MSEVFKFNEDDVRAVERDGEPWFVASDVAKILGYKNPRDAVRVHVDREDKWTGTTRVNRDSLQVNGLRRDTVMVNESGVYALIFGSELPTAKDFKRWVTKEVLPAIRSKGVYDRFDVDNSSSLLERSEALLNELHQRNMELAAQKKALEEENEELTPKGEVRDAIYESKGGYTRSDIWKMAKKMLGLKFRMVTFTDLLDEMGVTAKQPEKGQFVLLPEFYWMAEDALYFNDRLKSYLPNTNPHFTEEGKDRLMEMISEKREKLTKV